LLYLFNSKTKISIKTLHLDEYIRLNLQKICVSIDVKVFLVVDAFFS